MVTQSEPAKWPPRLVNSIEHSPGTPSPSQILSLPAAQEELEVVHRRSQLVVGRSRIVRTAVADPSVVEVVQFGPNEISIIGSSPGSTTLTLWFEDASEPLIYLVTTIRDPKLDERRRVDFGKLERKLAVLFPNSEVYLIPLSGKLIIKGQAQSKDEADRIVEIVRGEVLHHEGRPQQTGIPLRLTGHGNNPADPVADSVVNMLDVPGEYQVTLHIWIAEINRAHLRRLGVDWNHLFKKGNDAALPAKGGLPGTLTGIFENDRAKSLVHALTAEGAVKVLSHPRLTVVNGHDASFLAGGEFAVPKVAGLDGVAGQGADFRGFGTSVFVTPTVLDQQTIRIRIMPEFSELSSGHTVAGIPGLNSRRVQTTVDLTEGETLAIAGLNGQRCETQLRQVPILSDLPFVGPRWFSTKRTTYDETELLILVTPEIIRPIQWSRQKSEESL